MMHRVKQNVFAIVLLSASFSPVAAQSGFPVFAYDSYGKWGYCYQGINFVLPCYDNVVDLGSYCTAFWAQQDSVWGLRRLDNSEIIPFTFDDICTASQYEQESLAISLDSIEMFDRGTILPAVTLERDYRYRFSSNMVSCPPLLPVKKEGKWGYVDFRGNTIIPFEYDEAFMFTSWLGGYKNRANYLAEVRKDGLSAWIDVFGEIIIPWQESRTFSLKEKKNYLRKMKPDEAQRYETRISLLSDRKDSALVAKDYVNRFTQEIKIVEVNSKKGETSAKSAYRILYEDDTPVVPDSVDFVFEREGDALRVRIADKMRVIDLNTGWLPFPAYDSIAPFDSKGQALAWSGKEECHIGLHGTWSPKNHSYRAYLAEIQSLAREAKWAEAATMATNFSAVIPYYGSPWYRKACDATIRYVAEKYNYYCNPVLIAERERIEAEKKAKKGESGWAILGGLLSAAGSFSKSSTSQNIKALGETIKSVADPNETTSEATDYQTLSAKTNVETANIPMLQAQINAIDQNLEQVSAQQVQLAHERQKAKGQVSSTGMLGAPTATGSNATRNFSASRVQQRAQQRAKAQTPARNRLSSIDSQLNQLMDKKATLLAQREELSEKIKQLTDDSNDETNSRPSSSAKSYEKKKTINVGVYTASQRTLNIIGKELSDLYVKHQDRTEVFTADDKSRVKSLQNKAKEVRKSCLEQTGQTLPANSLENWNP